MFKLGLTGSIGMGKSTTADMFHAAGCAVWDADAAVHRLYAVGGLAVDPMRAEFGEAVIQDGAVSRAALREMIVADATTLPKLEKIVHPLLAQDRADFIENANADILVFDIPLLFETGGNRRMDAVACVWTPADIQEARVMARGRMSMEQFEKIKSAQMPADEKRALADYVIETDTLEHARAQVHSVIKDIEQRIADA